jgi:Uma2 family endonuclease
VLSPSTRQTDRGRKLQTFARFGVPEYWIVDPDAPSVEVLRLEGDAYAIACAAGPGGEVTSPTLSELRFALRVLMPSDESGTRHDR